MSDPIRKLNIMQFGQLLGAANLARRIIEVHLHHTWRPRRRDFRGLATIEAMRRFHMETNGWADIAQHLTIDPEGGLWTGRNWNVRPASSSGFNGSDAEGPFMIEMIGDFDTGQDPFDGPQKAAAIEVTARLLQRFGLDRKAVKFHRQLNSPKTCPGTGIDYARLTDEIAEAQEGLAGDWRPRAVRLPFSAEHLAGFASTRSAGPAQEPEFAEVPEHTAAGQEIERLSHAATWSSAGRHQPSSCVLIHVCMSAMRAARAGCVFTGGAELSATAFSPSSEVAFCSSCVETPVMMKDPRLNC